MGHKLKETKDANAEFRRLTPDFTVTQLFTDGSKNPDALSVGAAVFCPQLNVSLVSLSKSLTAKASIFTAKCLALYCALELALKIVNKIGRKEFNIFTDSLSALLGLNSLSHTIKTNPYIFEINH